MKRPIIYIGLFLTGLIIILGLYYNARKECTKDIFSQKAVTNQTVIFFNKICGGMEVSVDSINRLLGSEYTIEKISINHIKVTPKGFNVHDFSGFEIKIDTSTNKIRYIGLYKP